MTSIMMGAMASPPSVRFHDALPLVPELPEVVEGLGHVLDRGVERGRVGARGPDRLGLGADHAQRIEESQVEGVELIERLLVHVVEIEEPGVPAARELDDPAPALETAGAPPKRGPGGGAGRPPAGFLSVLPPLD